MLGEQAREIGTILCFENTLVKSDCTRISFCRLPPIFSGKHLYRSRDPMPCKTIGLPSLHDIRRVFDKTFFIPRIEI